MSKVVYPTIEQAVAIHAKTVEVSGGGAVDAINLDALCGVLEHIQNDDYYPTMEEKLTHLLFSVSQFHCFQDGNKRIAIVLCAHMLLLNGYLYCANTFLPDMENIVFNVASGKIDKSLLREVIAAHINEDRENEDLKLKILAAITRPDNA